MSSFDLTRDYASVRPGEDSSAERMRSRTIGYIEANLWPYLSQKPKSISILEIGPGTGVLADWLRSRGFDNYTCVEACESYADDLIRRRFKCIFGHDLVALKRDALKGRSFDFIIYMDVLEHIERDAVYPTLEVSLNFLNFCGEIFIQVPNVSGLFGMNTQFSDFTHRSAFNENTLTGLLQGVGFMNVRASQVLLPKSYGNWVRERMRSLVFKLVRFCMKIVGATPIRVLSHLMIVTAQKERSPN